MLKTIIILAILSIPVYYGLKKVVDVLIGKETGCSCDIDSCSSGNCPISKKN